MSTADTCRSVKAQPRTWLTQTGMSGTARDLSADARNAVVALAALASSVEGDCNTSASLRDADPIGPPLQTREQSSPAAKPCSRSHAGSNSIVSVSRPAA